MTNGTMLLEQKSEMRLTKQAMDELIRCDEFPCVTMILPTIIRGREVRQNHVRFRNLINDAERRLSRRASRQGFSPAPGVASPVRVASPPPVGSFAPPPDAPRPTPSKPLKELVATISKELGLAPGLSLSAALAEAARLMGVEPTGTLPQQAAVLVAAISGA